MHFFGYRVNITADQFFKYGYAEMKMLLCCDVITLVKRKHKQLNIHRSLSANKTTSTRSRRRETVSPHDSRRKTHGYERAAASGSRDLEGVMG